MGQDEQSMPLAKAGSYNLGHKVSLPTTIMDSLKNEIEAALHGLHPERVRPDSSRLRDQPHVNCPVESNGPEQARVCMSPKGIKGRVRF